MRDAEIIRCIDSSLISMDPSRTGNAENVQLSVFGAEFLKVGPRGAKG